MTSIELSGALVRRANSVACLQAVRLHDAPRSVSEVADETGLSRPTVDAVLTGLAADHTLFEATDTTSTGAGRPARRFGFAAGAGVVAGIDAGPHSIRVIISDLAGRILARTRTPIKGGLAAGVRVRQLRQCVTAALTEAGSEVTDLRAAALGVPGILDAGERMINSLAIPEWIGYDLAGRLGDRWDCPVVLENDIKLAALAEHHVGAARDVSNLVFLQMGHRISLALIMDGKILQGSHRLAGELGSLRGMKWTSTSTRGQLRWQTARTARQVFEAAAQGGTAAAQEIDAFCTEVAARIAGIVLTVDPELVVVGGGLSQAGDRFLGPLQHAVDHVLMTSHKPDFVGSELTADGVAIGALGNAFDRCSADIVGIPAVPAPWAAWRAPPPDPSNPLTTKSRPSRSTTRTSNHTGP